MTQVISLVAPAKAMTPAQSPMELDDQEGPRGFRPTADTPGSPSPRLSGLGSKKRAASINTSEANYARLEKLRIDSPNNMDVNTSQDLICLCTPAPKIPRPRNAFILYRQHFQTQVAAQNPTMSNPEISKIIGEKWRDEPEEVRDTWKGLAEEEKQRHQRQYPDYRYQPRRGARAQAAKPGSSPSEEPGRCPKCHGRSIATPRTPSTPLVTPLGARLATNPNMTGLRADEIEVARRGSRGPLPANRPRYLNQRAEPHELEDYGPESPELKRRRYNSNNAGNYQVVSSPRLPHEAYGGRLPASPMRSASMGGVMRHYGPPHLPEPGSVPRSRSGPMPPPPPRPSTAGSWTDPIYRTGRHASFDESLRLPPLKTSIPMSPSVASEADGRHVNTPVTARSAIAASGRTWQPRSADGAIMQIPFNAKLEVLAKISPPLAPRGPGLETRGAIIAVEGSKPHLLRQVGKTIEKALGMADEIALKTWENHTITDNEASNLEKARTRMEMHSNYMSYLQTMHKWHEKSAEMIQYITTTAGSSQEDENIQDENHSRRDSSGSAESRGTPEAKEPGQKQRKTPVALLKEGFSMTISDHFARATPIIDQYTAIDHWQWWATLWRGTVGPDLVVYVKPSREEEMAKSATVAYQPRPGLLVVMVPIGKDLDEATERRVAFEVIEWMRGGSFREGSGRN